MVPNYTYNNFVFFCVHGYLADDAVTKIAQQFANSHLTPTNLIFPYWEILLTVDLGFFFKFYVLFICTLHVEQCCIGQ